MWGPRAIEPANGSASFTLALAELADPSDGCVQWGLVPERHSAWVLEVCCGRGDLGPALRGGGWDVELL